MHLAFQGLNSDGKRTKGEARSFGSVRATNQRKSLLGDLALDLRKHGVGVAANQPNRSDHNDEDDCQHDGVFRYVLATFLNPQLTKSLYHVPAPFGG